jgi:hypothetical protein
MYFVSVTCDDPLYIMSHSKTVLSQAISSDTEFLASQSVIDYSLLVGLDKERRELVVGIIGMYCSHYVVSIVGMYCSHYVVGIIGMYCSHYVVSV